jgi:SAM-dependent methyltransferase/uncharacterized protein YbaR (Trm112 family)
MNPELAERLVCPGCGHHPLSIDAFERRPDGKIITGILWCPECRAWYPIEEGLLELLVDTLAYTDDRLRFWAAHETRLKTHAVRQTAAIHPPGAGQPQLHQRAHFDWYASNTQQTYSAYENSPFWRAVDDLAFEDWRKEMETFGYLLDVGCAQGRSTFRVMPLNLRVIAFDISKALVRQALNRYEQSRGQAKTDFFVGDATRLPFVSQSFDYVLIYGVLHHLPEPQRTCQEVARILKPGGKYFGCENNVSIFRSIFDLLQRLRPLWHEEAGSQPLMSRQDIQRWFQNQPLAVSVDTRVFLPPHAVNRLGHRWAKRLLSTTDRLFSLMPVMKDQGGLIFIRGTKPR